MNTWSSIKQSVMESTLLAQRGAHDEALMLLKTCIDGIDENAPKEGVHILLCHAAILLLANGDSRLAAKYIEANVERFPDDPFSLYLMAEVLDRNGAPDQSHSFALKSMEAALKQSSARSEAILELIQQRWPDLAKPGGDIRM